MSNRFLKNTSNVDFCQIIFSIITRTCRPFIYLELWFSFGGKVANNEDAATGHERCPGTQLHLFYLGNLRKNQNIPISPLNLPFWSISNGVGHSKFIWLKRWTWVTGHLLSPDKLSTGQFPDVQMRKLVVENKIKSNCEMRQPCMCMNHVRSTLDFAKNINIWEIDWATKSRGRSSDRISEFVRECTLFSLKKSFLYCIDGQGYCKPTKEFHFWKGIQRIVTFNTEWYKIQPILYCCCNLYKSGPRRISLPNPWAEHFVSDWWLQSKNRRFSEFLKF